MRLKHSHRSTLRGEGCYCSTLSDAAVKAMSTLSAMLPIQACTFHTQLSLKQSPDRCAYNDHQAACCAFHKQVWRQEPASSRHSGKRQTRSHLIKAAKASLCVCGSHQDALIAHRLHKDALRVLWEVLRELHPACTVPSLA